MQTFLPFPSMTDSWRSLDKLRMNKQILEVTQILDTLEFGSRWENHPAVRMWEGYEDALGKYHNIGLKVWEKRGGGGDRKAYARTPHQTLPWWWGFEPFHWSHQANLRRKDPIFYTPKFKASVYNDPRIFYLWPSMDHKDNPDWAVFYVTTPKHATDEDIVFNMEHYAALSHILDPMEKTKYRTPRRIATRYLVSFKKTTKGTIMFNPKPQNL
jgi:hypothetical protein